MFVYGKILKDSFLRQTVTKCSRSSHNNSFTHLKDQHFTTSQTASQIMISKHVNNRLPTSSQLISH